MNVMTEEQIGSGPAPAPSRRSMVRRLAAVLVIAAAIGIYFGLSHYEPLSLTDRGGGYSSRPTSPGLVTASQIDLNNGGPFGVDVVAVTPLDSGNVTVDSDALGPCTSLTHTPVGCRFNLGTAAALVPVSNHGVAANATLLLEHAMTLDCTGLAKGYTIQLSQMVDVTYRFAWFTRTVRLPYRYANGLNPNTYHCPS